ncbi:MAG: lipoyl synthase [Pseudanabaenaceae cyanobacterium bins.68]|nr:lipoyl synthase [Pseudanabaenaceae cyanobacterium bins.68]
MTQITRLPTWFRHQINLGGAAEIAAVQKIVRQYQIHTICEEGRCPNRGECYAAKTATFLLMGAVCTRNCGFCQVDKGHAPMPLDAGEPAKIAAAVAELGLSYVVLTSVARDDLGDQGAGHFVATIAAIRAQLPAVKIEVLTPDFRGEQGLILQVAGALPVCYNHNIETVKRLQAKVRRGAKYERSLQVLQVVRQHFPQITTKSGLMLGHGETEAEVIETLEDLAQAGCQAVTLGQYLRPSLAHLPVVRYWTPAEFEALGAIARRLGFKQVRSGSLVRSSYHAGAEA